VTSFEAALDGTEAASNVPVDAVVASLPRLEAEDAADASSDWIVVGGPAPHVPDDVAASVAAMDATAAPGPEVDVGSSRDGRRIFRMHLPSLEPRTLAARVAGQTVGRVVRRFHGLRLRWSIEGADAEASAAFLEGVRCGAYRSPSPRRSTETSGSRNVLVGTGALSTNEARRIDAHSSATVATRSMVERPANELTPSAFARIAARWSDAADWSCEVVEASDLLAEGFRATHALGVSSAHPPCVVVIRNRPNVAVGTVIVAKGITFDAGGISLKPAANMGKLKGDMAGAAAALCGTLAAEMAAGPSKASVDEGPTAPLPSIALVLPLAENLPDGNALRPGDIVTFADDTRVHIESTDAEGRMILADGVLYAKRRWSPQRVVTMGTLTKACIVALGNHFGALYSPDDDLAEDLRRAGEAAGERLWRMPVGGLYGAWLRHDVADIANSSNDGGGSIYAATFIQQFAGDTSWAHLDMSSFFFMDRGFAWTDRGYTGVGARLVAQFLASDTLEQERAPGG
jgi:leucyl aminopeptidase